MSNPNSLDCLASAVEGVFFDDPLSAHQAALVDAAGFRTQERGRVFPRCLNSLDVELQCPLAVLGSRFAAECALGKVIIQAEAPTIREIYREPGEGIVS